MNKKGMEMWQIVLIILALLFLVVIGIFWGEIGTKIEGLLGKFGGLF